MKLLNWNTEWAVPGSKRGDRVAKVIERAGAELICLTEAYPGMMPEQGFTIAATDDTGYPLPKGRRKVLLWSREPCSSGPHPQLGSDHAKSNVRNEISRF